MRGTALLADHRVPFSVIAVVSLQQIPVIVNRADEFLGFFRSLGAAEVGLNIEEHEGRHQVASGDDDLVRSFWESLLHAWIAAAGQPRIRDFNRVLDFARASVSGTWRPPVIDLFPTITVHGDVVLLSPELAGYGSESYGDFVVGNIYDEPLTSILERGASASYVVEFADGTQRCRRECSHFDYCHGGQAANRFFEHGDFLTHETQFCRRSRQAPFDAIFNVHDSDDNRNKRRTDDRIEP